MSKLKEKGITLLSLIVTVIILLILIGVTIGQITGNKGLFNRVRKTVSQYENAQEQEDAGMVELETMLAEEREKEEELQSTTANPNDVLLGKTYYTGDKIFSTGAMPNHGGNNIEVTEEETEIPKGYYDGTGKIISNIIYNDEKIAYRWSDYHFGESSSFTSYANYNADVTKGYMSAYNTAYLNTKRLEHIGDTSQMLFRVLKSGVYSIYWFRINANGGSCNMRVKVNQEIVAEGSTVVDCPFKWLFYSANLSENSTIMLEGMLEAGSVNAQDGIIIF